MPDKRPTGPPRGAGRALHTTSATPLARHDLILLGLTMMGAQSGLIGPLDVPVSTTYVTGTWTSLSAGVARSLRGLGLPTGASEAAHGQTLRVQAFVVAAYLATAFGAAITYLHIGALASLIPLGVLLTVIIGTVDADVRTVDAGLS